MERTRKEKIVDKKRNFNEEDDPKNTKFFFFFGQVNTKLLEQKKILS